MRTRKLKAIAREFRAGILGKRSSARMSMVVSAPLAGFLSAVYGVGCAVEELDFGHANHVVIRLPDGRILDATADQFGLEPVYLGPMPEKYVMWMAGK
jgi:hypothetical protein